LDTREDMEVQEYQHLIKSLRSEQFMDNECSILIAYDSLVRTYGFNKKYRAPPKINKYFRNRQILNLYEKS